jgi:hypothetical protein
MLGNDVGEAVELGNGVVVGVIVAIMRGVSVGARIVEAFNVGEPKQLAIRNKQLANNEKSFGLI